MGGEAKERVARHRDRMRQSGLRPIQLWALDSSADEVAAALSAQCRAVNASHDEPATIEWVDQVAAEIEGWR
jgi:hypothetical protein